MRQNSNLISKLLVFFVAIFLTFSGCRKSDVIGIDGKPDYETLKKQFFNTDAANDIEITNLAKDIKRQDSIFKFLPEFVKKNGMPKWDKVLYKTKNRNGTSSKSPTIVSNNQVATFGDNPTTTPTQGVFFIPLQSTTSNEVKSYITAYKHNDSLYTYRLYNKDSLAEVRTNNPQEKSNLLNTEAVFGYFEKTVNNKDSAVISNGINKTVIKNASLTIKDKGVGNSSVGVNNENIVLGGGCDVSFDISISFTQIDIYYNGVYVGSKVIVAVIVSITIDCGGGGGGGCGCGNGGTPGSGSGGGTPGNGNPNNPGGGTPGSGNPSNPGGSTPGNGNPYNPGGGWWDSGTGWPNFGPYDPYNPNPNYPSFPGGIGWWTGGGNNMTPIQSFYNSLSTAEVNFWDSPSNFLIVSTLTDRLNRGGFSADVKDFIKWCIDYLINNPNVNFQDFQNQFLTQSEGPDGSFDDAFWSNPSLSFTQQNLPTWNDFQAAFPLNTDPLYDTPEKMYTSIGGQLTTFYNANKDRDGKLNTCAVRLSKALNYSGVTIPSIPGKTLKGSDNLYYFKGAKDMNEWMRKTFGTTPSNANHHHYTNADAGINGRNLPTLLNGKKGIYSLVSSDSGWGTGHCDLINNNCTCGNSCHFDAPIDYIDIWELQ